MAVQDHLELEPAADRVKPPGREGSRRKMRPRRACQHAAFAVSRRQLDMALSGLRQKKLQVAGRPASGTLPARRHQSRCSPDRG